MTHQPKINVLCLEPLGALSLLISRPSRLREANSEIREGNVRDEEKKKRKEEKKVF